MFNNNKLKSQFLLFLGTLMDVIFNACNVSQTPAGGPCGYNTKVHPAAIIMLDSIKNDDWDLKVCVNIYGKIDTISYYLHEHTYIKNSDLKRNGIQVGDTIKYVERNLKSGACNPHLLTLILEKYK